ncbi:PD-(D/E)XK nuclease family protein [Asaia sp. HN010]|uniref:PDDEXK-like family protein n=1 Tax=Asaia sp. HN010 TaxID=3081233 RepID=UPI003018CDE7
MSSLSQLHSFPTLDDLESLFVNNAELDCIREHISRFNPIKTMGMARKEIRHSAILGWLLSPQETHGLGDKFLKSFLAEALRGHHESMRPSALDVSQADMMDAEIRREWRNIDIFISTQRNGWLFIVENKFDSLQHDNQLERYKNTVRSIFDKEEYPYLRGIFLTLWDEDPEDEDYAPIQYGAICRILEQKAFSKRNFLPPEVETFLRHYLEIIKEASGMSEERKTLERLARQLYRDHKRVLDFIVENGKTTDFSIACEAVFGEDLECLAKMTVSDDEFIFNSSDSNTFSFLPADWFHALSGEDYYWHGCENWWMGFPVITWLQLTTNSDGTSGQVRIFAEVGPISNYEFRKELIEKIVEASKEHKLTRIGFQRGATDEGKKYSKMLKKNSFPIDDIHDNDKISAAIKKALRSFKEEFAVIGAILPQFVQHGRTESSSAS